MGSFVIGEVGEYIPRLIQENTFLNDKLESDTYGIYYSVQFEGDADTFLIQAKKAPVEGQPEWGMIEMSKSGKSKRFKRVKREDSVTHSSPTLSPEKAYMKDTSDLPRSLVIELLKYYDVQGLYNSDNYVGMINLAQSLNDDIMAMIEANRSGSLKTNPPAEIKEQSAVAELAIKHKLDKGWSDAKGISDEPYETDDGYER